MNHLGLTLVISMAVPGFAQSVIDPGIRTIAQSALTKYGFTEAWIYKNSNQYLFMLRKAKDTKLESVLISRYFLFESNSRVLAPVPQALVRGNPLYEPKMFFHTTAKDPEFKFLYVISKPLPSPLTIY
jgi:hypothetical protein